MTIACSIFALVIIALEFFAPDVIIKNAAFLFNFFGRFLFYLFLGCLILLPTGFALVAGIIVMVVGFINLILFIVPTVNPPEPGGWAKKSHSRAVQGQQPVQEV